MTIIIIIVITITHWLRLVLRQRVVIWFRFWQVVGELRCARIKLKQTYRFEWP